MRAGPTLAAVLASLLAAPAAAQQDDSGADNLDGPVSVRCSALAEMEQAEQITTVFYIAGYYDGQRDATTIATVGQSAETAGQALTNEQQAPTDQQQAATNEQAPTDEQQVPAEGGEPARTGANAAGTIPELALEAILAACAQSPDSRIADIITAHLGSPAE